jgi:hypothetical protein
MNDKNGECAHGCDVRNSAFFLWMEKVVQIVVFFVGGGEKWCGFAGSVVVRSTNVVLSTEREKLAGVPVRQSGPKPRPVCTTMISPPILVDPFSTLHTDIPHCVGASKQSSRGWPMDERVSDHCRRAAGCSVVGGYSSFGSIMCAGEGMVSLGGWVTGLLTGRCVSSQRVREG